MALPDRLTFPEDSLPLETGKIDGFVRSLRLAVLEVFTDQAKTTLADVQTAGGVTIINSRITLTNDSAIPDFLGPAGQVDTLWGSVNGGIAFPLRAKHDQRLDDHSTRLDALAATISSDSTVVHKTGTETIAGNKDFTGALTKSGSAVVVTSDTRLSDQRTPTDGSVTLAKMAFDVATQTELDAAVAAEVTRADAAIAGKAPKLVRTAVKTSNYAAAAGDLVPVDTTSASVAVTLPTAPAVGSRVAVKHVVLGGSNVVTVACAGSDVFNKAGGPTSLTLSLLNQSVNVQYDAGGVWTVVADDLPLSSLTALYTGTFAPTDATDETVTLYVSTTGSDSNNGRSWKKAKATVNGALAALYAAVGSHGVAGRIEVGAGTFPAFVLDGWNNPLRGVSVRGRGPGLTSIVSTAAGVDAINVTGSYGTAGPAGTTPIEIHLEDLFVAGSKTGTITGHGLNLSGADWDGIALLTVRRCDFIGNGGHGVYGHNVNTAIFDTCQNRSNRLNGWHFSGNGNDPVTAGHITQPQRGNTWLFINTVNYDNDYNWYFDQIGVTVTILSGETHNARVATMQINPGDSTGCIRLINFHGESNADGIILGDAKANGFLLQGFAAENLFMSATTSGIDVKLNGVNGAIFEGAILSGSVVGIDADAYSAAQSWELRQCLTPSGTKLLRHKGAIINKLSGRVAFNAGMQRRYVNSTLGIDSNTPDGVAPPVDYVQLGGGQTNDYVRFVQENGAAFVERFKVAYDGKMTLAGDTAATLYRSTTGTVKTDGIFSAAGSIVIPASSSAPASPVDGMLWLDTTIPAAPVFKARVGGAWIATATKGDPGPATTDPGLWTPAKQGLLSWTCDPRQASSGKTLPLGVLQLVRFYAATASAHGSLRFVMTVAAGTPVTGQNFMGVYDSTGALIASTGDISTTVGGSTGSKSVSLTSGFTPAVGDAFWVGFLVNATSTPQVLCTPQTTASAMNDNLTAAGGLRVATYGTAQTTLPSSLTLGLMVAASTEPYVGLK